VAFTGLLIDHQYRQILGGAFTVSAQRRIPADASEELPAEHRTDPAIHPHPAPKFPAHRRIPAVAAHLITGLGPISDIVPGRNGFVVEP